MEEALTSDYADNLKKAADSEYESLINNDTWTIVELVLQLDASGSLKLNKTVKVE